eukprot:305785-Pelagomonas_calceolata.AAC.1
MGVPLSWKELTRMTDHGRRWSGCGWQMYKCQQNMETKPCAEFKSVNCCKESHAQSLYMKQACKVMHINSIRLQCQILEIHLLTA